MRSRTWTARACTMCQADADGGAWPGPGESAAVRSDARPPGLQWKLNTHCLPRTSMRVSPALIVSASLLALACGPGTDASESTEESLDRSRVAFGINLRGDSIGAARPAGFALERTCHNPGDRGRDSRELALISKGVRIHTSIKGSGSWQNVTNGGDDAALTARVASGAAGHAPPCPLGSCRASKTRSLDLRRARRGLADGGCPAELRRGLSRRKAARTHTALPGAGLGGRPPT